MKKKTLLIIAGALAVCLAVILSITIICCGKSDESTLPPVASGSVVVTPEAVIPTGVDPSIRGYITRITYSAESTEILIEDLTDSDAAYSYDKALVKIDSNTALAVDNGTPVDLSYLTIGSEVEAWFSDPSQESYPVFAYGQAIRVIKNSEGVTGIRRLPRLSVCGSSNSMAAVTYLDWKGEVREFESMKTLLSNTLGAHISAAPGDTLTLKFSRKPSDIEVNCAALPVIEGTPLPVSEDGKITLPQDSGDVIYVRVNAKWGNDAVCYAFAISFIAQK